MISHKDLDTALELIDNIVDQIRCVNCDNSTLSRGKLSCGHVVCDKCIKSLAVCPNCDQSITETIQCDPVLLKYSIHATTLLHVFQESVYNKYAIKSRISDQQKMEKEIFPNCIQAPQKYSNRKKSINNKLMISNTNTSFPGENVSRASILKSSKKVEDWLERNESVSTTDRSPFADLNVNSPITSSTPKSKRVSLRNVLKLKIANNMSKQNSKTDGNDSKKCDNSTANITVRKRSSSMTLSKHSSKLFKQESVMIPSTDGNKVEIRNESLPAPECDEVIVLEDSQTDYICEKDRQACLAVLAADKMAALEQNTTTISDDTDKAMTSQNVVQSKKSMTDTRRKSQSSYKLRKIPFYKKGVLHRKKQQNDVFCFDTANLDNEPGNVSIVIETQDFVTKVEVTKCANETFYKTSKCCQTDFVTDNIDTGSLQQPSTYNKDNVKLNNENKRNIPKNNTESQDLFTCEKVIVEDIIEDSDASSNSCMGNLVTTVAQIHNAGVQSHKVLSTLNQTAAAFRMALPKKQRYVASSDSSDKENRDPNIMKKGKGKKAAKKRKLK